MLLNVQSLKCMEANLSAILWMKVYRYMEAMDTFIAESLLLRVIKVADRTGDENAAVPIAMMQCYLNDAADKIAKSAKEAINAFAAGDEQKMMLLGLKRFTKSASFNSKDAR